MKKSDIVFIFPKGSATSVSSLEESQFSFSLGAGYIAAYLKKQKILSTFYVPEDSVTYRDSAREIVELYPKIVGFTVYYSNYFQCLSLAKRIKLLNRKIIIVFGGVATNVKHRFILKNSDSIDICLRGEGEEIFFELIKELERNNFEIKRSYLESINNISFKVDSEVYCTDSKNTLLLNNSTQHYLDTYPSPYLSGVIPPNEVYSAGVITSRGCNQSCTYCNCAVLSNRSVFFHSINHVIEELKYISSHVTMDTGKEIPIYDDAFTLAPNRARHICNEMIKNDISLPMLCITRCDKIDEELLELMKRAGFTSISFSLESATPSILRRLGKVSKPKLNGNSKFEKEQKFISNLKAMTAKAKKVGFKVAVSIMIGLPSESIKEANKTVELVNSLNIDSYNHNIFQVFEGTKISLEKDELGYGEHRVSEVELEAVTTHPINVYDIRMGPKASAWTEKFFEDRICFDIINLYTTRRERKDFFRNVIVSSDVLNEKIVRWLFESVAINGNIIQIYSSQEEYHNKTHKNKRYLLEGGWGITSWTEYITVEKDGETKLMPARSIKVKGLGQDLKYCQPNLEWWRENSFSLQNYALFENNKQDCKHLYKKISSISRENDCLEKLICSKAFPYFTGLCRWTKNPNCRVMETVLIDSDYNIRICWNGNVIGTVNDNYSKLLRRIECLSVNTRIERKCSHCELDKYCGKCLFVEPLGVGEYCKSLSPSIMGAADGIKQIKQLEKSIQPFQND